MLRAFPVAASSTPSCWADDWTLALIEPTLVHPITSEIVNITDTATNAAISWRRTEEIRIDTRQGSFRAGTLWLIGDGKICLRPARGASATYAAWTTSGVLGTSQPAMRMLGSSASATSNGAPGPVITR